MKMTSMRFPKFSFIHVDSIDSRVFSVLAFFVPLMVRALPEFLMGGYSVGFDTISYYVPVTSRWISNGVGFWEFIGYAPLFYLLLVGFALAGVPLTVSLKVLPSLLHGFLGLVIYIYARKGLAWSCKKSLFVSLLAVLYFVGLRISWDMLRCELGLIFLLAFLIMLHECLSKDQWKLFGLLLSCMVLVVLTHQLVAAIMFAVVFTVVLKKLISRSYDAVWRLILSSIPAVVLLGLVVYADFAVLPSVSTASVAGSGLGWLSLFGFPSIFEGVADTLGFLFYCYLPLLPFVFVGIKGFRSLELKVWSIWCLIAVLFPFFLSFAPLGYRWILLLAFPMAFFAVEGFGRLNFGFWKKIWAGLLVVLSLSFVFLPAEAAFPYFSVFPYYVPSSMLQNSVPLSDCGDVVKVLKWVEANIGDDGFLLVHDAFQGWVLLYLNNGVRVVQYGYASPEEAARVTFGSGHAKVYLVWWVSSRGWHGWTSLPSCFVEVFRSGRIAAYEYGAV